MNSSYTFVHTDLAAGNVDAASSQLLSTEMYPRDRTSTRVCDRCIKKKVKCDMKRPRCSRCKEAGCGCLYTSQRKKPGPVKGSSKPRFAASDCDGNTPPLSQTSSSIERNSNPNCPPDDFNFDFDSLDALLPVSLEEPIIFQYPNLELSLPPATGSHFALADMKLSPNQERELLHEFFRRVHPSIRLFLEDRFLHQYETGLVNDSLLYTILILTAKIVGHYKFWDFRSVDDSVARLLDTHIGEETLRSGLTLDIFRQECLLVFYDFHQHPGHKSWMRLTQLTRLALQYSLHQIDSSDSFSMIDDSIIQASDLDDWRYVWWFLYCLDSYSNITAGTPFVVEFESLRTALIMKPNPSSITANEQVFLPVDIGFIWNTAASVNRPGFDFNFNMHIITTTVLKEAAKLHRLALQNPPGQFESRGLLLSDYLTSLRLALPPQYLSEGRDAFCGESHFEHQARLVCLIHLHAARIIISLPHSYSAESELDWRRLWQQSLGYCQDIVCCVREWDAQFCSTVDPAICFIILACLVILHIHKVQDLPPDPELHTRIQAHIQVLILFLRQFTSPWKLPAFLLVSFRRFSHIISGPLTAADIFLILKQFPGPLNRRWLSFLGLTSEFEQSQSPGISTEQSLPSGVSDLYNWMQDLDFPDSNTTPQV